MHSKNTSKNGIADWKNVLNIKESTLNIIYVLFNLVFKENHRALFGGGGFYIDEPQYTFIETVAFIFSSMN